MKNGDMNKDPYYALLNAISEDIREVRTDIKEVKDNQMSFREFIGQSTEDRKNINIRLDSHHVRLTHLEKTIAEIAGDEKKKNLSQYLRERLQGPSSARQ